MDEKKCIDIEVTTSLLLCAIEDASETVPEEKRFEVPLMIGASEEEIAITIERTPGTVWVRATPVQATVHEEGIIVMSLRRITNVLRTIANEKVRITATASHQGRTSSNGKTVDVEIVAGETTIKFREFAELRQPPSTQGAEVFEIIADKLVDLIGKTLFSVSTDEARVNLNGALFESNGKAATMVSTDGHRLTKYTVPLEGPKLGAGIIIPRSGLQEIRSALNRTSKATCRIGITEECVFVETDDLTVIAKLNKARFPPYEKIIPKKTTHKAMARRTELLTALKTAQACAPERTSTIVLEFQHQLLKVSTDNIEVHGTASTEMGIEWEGAPLRAGFNASYLIDAINALGTNYVSLEFPGGDLEPVTIRSVDPQTEIEAAISEHKPGFMAIVMPKRI